MRERERERERHIRRDTQTTHAGWPCGPPLLIPFAVHFIYILTGVINHVPCFFSPPPPSQHPIAHLQPPNSGKEGCRSVCASPPERGAVTYLSVSMEYRIFLFWACQALTAQAQPRALVLKGAPLCTRQGAASDRRLVFMEEGLS